MSARADVDATAATLESAEAAIAMAEQEVAEAERIFAADESDAHWRRVEQARSARDRAKLRAANAATRHQEAADRLLDAEITVLEAQHARDLAAASRDAWREAVAPHIRRLLRAQEDQPAALAAVCRATFDQHEAVEIATETGRALTGKVRERARRQGTPSSAFFDGGTQVDQSDVRVHVSHALAASGGFPDAPPEVRRLFTYPDEFAGVLAPPRGPLPYAIPPSWVRSFAPSVAVLDVGPGPDVDVQDLSPSHPEAA